MRDSRDGKGHPGRRERRNSLIKEASYEQEKGRSREEHALRYRQRQIACDSAAAAGAGAQSGRRGSEPRQRRKAVPVHHRATGVFSVQLPDHTDESDLLGAVQAPQERIVYGVRRVDRAGNCRIHGREGAHAAVYVDGRADAEGRDHAHDHLLHLAADHIDVWKHLPGRGAADLYRDPPSAAQAGELHAGAFVVLRISDAVLLLVCAGCAFRRVPPVF